MTTSVNRTDLKSFRRRPSLDKRLETVSDIAARLEIVKDDLLARPYNHDTARQLMYVALLEMIGVVQSLYATGKASSVAKTAK